MNRKKYDVWPQFIANRMLKITQSVVIYINFGVFILDKYVK